MEDGIPCEEDSLELPELRHAVVMVDDVFDTVDGLLLLVAPLVCGIDETKLDRRRGAGLLFKSGELLICSAYWAKMSYIRCTVCSSSCDLFEGFVDAAAVDVTIAVETVLFCCTPSCSCVFGDDNSIIDFARFLFSSK